MAKKKGATIKRAAARKACRARNKRQLFLETSAQILRLAGAPEIQRGINELVDGSHKIGSSWFVRNEFEKTYVGFYNFVAEAAGMIEDPARLRPFEELWEEVQFLMPVYFPGGASLFPHLTTLMFKQFGGRLITPTILCGVFGGLKKDLQENFLQDTLFDKSSCEVWDTRGSCQSVRCQSEPGEHCRLREICVNKRDHFLASAATLAGARREESMWLRANLPRMGASNAKSLLELLGRHPGHVGDLIIFWEVPDGWTILTRDHTFKILQEAHRKKKVAVFKVRLPRLPSGKRCRVRPLSGGNNAAGVLINYNAKGARVRAPSITVKMREQVTITAPQLGSSRVGVVANIDPNDKSVFGVKFKFKRP